MKLRGITSGLQRRLLLMLIAPLLLLAFANAWFDYRSADTVAAQQDQRLLAILPLLADSVIAEGSRPGAPPVMLMAPPVEEFLKERPGFAAWGIVDPDGGPVAGEQWVAGMPPATHEPEYHSEEHAGVTYRIVKQRVQTVAGELVVALADGSDQRQQWARSIFFKVLLPNLVLIAAAAFAVGWGVERALRPLIELKEAVERRSPQDLNAIDEGASPDEVRPLVQSLNRLFVLVNAQAESQRRFVADAAHQLRTPLAGLQAQVEAWAQAAQAGGSGETEGQGAITLDAEQIGKLRSATRRTSQLANQLLALSRADARSMAAQPREPVELKALCESILEEHLDAATLRAIDFGLDVQPVTVMGHAWLLRELLANLADNAIKYAGQGGTVTLRCGMKRGRAFLEVEDDGPGVAPAEMPRLLERFYRVQGTLGEGNGLGLAIAEEIARVHGSHLRLADGATGRGLKVTLVFTAP